MTCCKELHNACRNQGYFFIKDFIAENVTLENVFSETSQFFKLPEEEKLKNKSLNTNQYLGYRGIGTEKSLLTGHAEFCEQYKIGYIYEKNNSSTLCLDYLLSYKSVFKKDVSAYFHEMERVATLLLKTIAVNLSLEQNYFLAYCNQPTHQLGLNNYPVNDNKTIHQKYAMSAHKDLCLLTIIAQNQAGLMIQNKKNEWQLIPNIKNSLFVLLGEYLEYWTNQYYLAPLHRVLESTKKQRISLIYKHRPNYETVIPVISGINPQKDSDDQMRTAFHTGKAYAEKIHRIMNDGK